MELSMGKYRFCWKLASYTYRSWRSSYSCSEHISRVETDGWSKHPCNVADHPHNSSRDHYRICWWMVFDWDVPSFALRQIDWSKRSVCSSSSLYCYRYSSDILVLTHNTWCSFSMSYDVANSSLIKNDFIDQNGTDALLDCVLSQRVSQ